MSDELDPQPPPLETLDFIARAQLALVHEAALQPAMAWEAVQLLVRLWRHSNGRRYRAVGIAVDDITLTLRMVFRDYLQEIRVEDAEEAERLQAALRPELEC